MSKPTNQPKLLLGDFSEVDAIALKELLGGPSGSRIIAGMEQKAPKSTAPEKGMEAYALASARREGFNMAITALFELAQFKAPAGPIAGLTTMDTATD